MNILGYSNEQFNRRMLLRRGLTAPHPPGRIHRGPAGLTEERDEPHGVGPD